MTYPETIQFLYELRFFGAKFGLENTFKLAALWGNPHERLRFIHVAGTNGKGSTCAMLESIYRAAGLRVGLFTSPHLVSFRERIQVNRRLIGEDDVVRLVGELRALGSEFRPACCGTANGPPGAGTPNAHELHPTFFEFVTVMALKFFTEQNCDLIIWETGLGGRLDATNIVTPVASVITNIQLDHQQWLGNTLGQIAAEKAGIIKPGIPIVTTTVEPEAFAVIERVARDKGAPLRQIRDAESVVRDSELSLLGEHQKTNAALAMAVVEVLQGEIPVAKGAVRSGLANVRWPGRLQLITTGAGGKILLDGAHNPAGAKALAETLKSEFPQAKPALILGVLEDKDWRHICETVAPLAGRILTVPVLSERSAHPTTLAGACRNINASAEVIACGSIGEALQKTDRAGFTLITGSLYLVGEVLEQLGLSPEARNERSLNEWIAAPPLPACG